MKNEITSTIKTYGYNIIHQPRSLTSSDKCRGGGVGILFNPQLINLTQVFVKTGDSFEAVMGKFRDSAGETVLCACVYRPGTLTDVFFKEFDDFVGSIFVKYRKFLICGDFNIHLDNKRSRNTVKFAELLSSYGLHQLVKVPTHKQGHLLDVVISSHKIVCQDSITLDTIDAAMFPNCDHFPVKFNLLGTSVLDFDV